MEIILSNHCKSITGSLGRGFGYYIKSHLSYKSGKERFFSQRCSKGSVPPDGHWRFITTCAELAQNGLHIADVRVYPQELSEALSEAGLPLSGAPGVRPEKIYSSSDILNLKERIGL